LGYHCLSAKVESFGGLGLPLADLPEVTASDVFGYLRLDSDESAGYRWISNFARDNAGLIECLVQGRWWLPNKIEECRAHARRFLIVETYWLGDRGMEAIQLNGSRLEILFAL